MRYCQSLQTYSNPFWVRCSLIRVWHLQKDSLQKSFSDIFESFLGALFLDQGFAFTKRFIAKIIFRHIDDEKVYFNDYKSKIKEYCDSREINIKYVLLEEHGVPHDKTFVMAIYLDDEEMGRL